MSIFVRKSTEAYPSPFGNAAVSSGRRNFCSTSDSLVNSAAVQNMVHLVHPESTMIRGVAPVGSFWSLPVCLVIRCYQVDRSHHKHLFRRSPRRSGSVGSRSQAGMSGRPVGYSSDDWFLRVAPHPGGMPALSRWSSAATPPEHDPRPPPHPGGMPEGWLAVGGYRVGQRCHPFRMGRTWRLPSGGVAALDHRLRAVTPAGNAVKDCHEVFPKVLPPLPHIRC